MNFDYSPKVKELESRLREFMDEHVYPNEERYHAEVASGDRWQPLELVEELKAKARSAALWNLFLPASARGAGLTNTEYAPLCEIMGRVPWAPEVFNCSAPDTGNMETLERYGDQAQKKRWLEPLLEGRIRSAFAMTEPDVASSDATNIASSIVRDGNDYVINGRKWWTSGAGDPRCKLIIFMGKTDPGAAKHAQQSMVLIPREAPGVKVLRHLPVFGYDDAPHGHMEIAFENVRVPLSDILLGEGRVLGCDQYRVVHRPRRRLVRDQRPQVVELGHRRPALPDPHLHGQDRREEPRPLQATVDDPSPARRAGDQGPSHADRVRLRRRPARPR